MDLIITRVVNTLIDAGISNEILIVILVLIIFYSIFQRFIKPVMDKFDSIPDRGYHDEKNLTLNDERRFLFDKLDAIETSLLSLEKIIKELEFNDKILLKETETLNKEIQQVRNSISQFQIQMMYGKTESFGNKEIR